MRITIEIDGTTFTAEPAQRDARASGASMRANTTAAMAAAGTGCAVTRGQETVGAYVDDSSITSSIKTRFVSDRDVDASSIKVETLNGTVMLSGFAKDRPKSFVFMARRNPVQEAILGEWGITALSGHDDSPERALTDFLAALNS